MPVVLGFGALSVDYGAIAGATYLLAAVAATLLVTGLAYGWGSWRGLARDERAVFVQGAFRYNLGARAVLPLGFSGSVEVEGRDESYFGYYHDGRLGSYDLLNAQVAWSNQKLTVSLWGRNLTDEEYATHGLYFGADPRDDFGAWSNQSYYQLGAPRTYGLEISYWL